MAPGQLPTHYAPKTRLALVDDLKNFSTLNGKRVGALFFRCGAEVGDPGSRSTIAAAGVLREVENFVAVRHLSQSGDLREAAANLFRMLRELDAENLDVIVAERVPEEGIGAAINDRLERASNKRTD